MKSFKQFIDVQGLVIDFFLEIPIRVKASFKIGRVTRINPLSNERCVSLTWG